jgi:formylglycine-generating enzyme required for sulfatase activity
MLPTGSSLYCTFPATTCATTARVNRGGGWIYDNPSDVRGANRNVSDPGLRYGVLGFRCAR